MKVDFSQASKNMPHIIDTKPPQYLILNYQKTIGNNCFLL